MTDTCTTQGHEVVRRFREAFAGERVTLERLRAGGLDWLLEEFYAHDVVST